MPEEKPDRKIELNAHDVTRIWTLAIHIYDGDDPDADLRNYFAQALEIYLEFMDDLTKGGLVFDDDENARRFTSEREWAPEGDKVRFLVTAIEKKEKKSPKKKKA